MSEPHILVIDQGTTSTRAILFDRRGRPRASHALALEQIYPANGWVEHDADAIWRAALGCIRRAALTLGDMGARIAAIGITNQRETSLLWDRATGKPLHNAIVWQDRRTAARCAALEKAGWGPKVARRTGLRLDAYFSATKLEWLLKHVPGARARARAGELAFGTIDSWLIWNLTEGRVHATDVTNASRTLLFDLKRRAWDDELLKLFGVAPALLPRVQDSQSDFGVTRLLGSEIPILGVAGDQQAASFGQACFAPGDIKATYGTGCFVLVNSGKAIPASRNRLLVTALAGSGGQGKRISVGTLPLPTPSGRATKQQEYAIEGSIFIAGAVVQWLRDELKIIAMAADSETLARRARPAPGLYVVPAFTGLGAPHWDAEARGAIVGLTRDAGTAEICRAALDSVCYQTRDLLDAMARDMAAQGLKKLRTLKVDGGMVANDWFCQRLADLTGLPVERPVVLETTALGAAYLAGLGAGLFKDKKDIAARWALDRRFVPAMKKTERDALYGGWQKAVARVR